ncbi:hypothetical protein [Xanthomonas arboricola]|uniref:hypothetical protein n=1 Tax=Xanthomonas arboricola TaxID=56448 RepID=UPI0032E8DA5C
MSQQLNDALTAVDWNKNVLSLCEDQSITEKIHLSISKVAILAQQIQIIDKDALALPFIQEMQLASHDVARCLALSLYKPAAAAMRSMLECALYYSYFRTHPVELKTLVRNNGYYLAKKEILEFFQTHVDNWSAKQSGIALVSRLERWYSKVSAIVHGQIPGHWRDVREDNSAKHDPEILEEAVVILCDSSEIIRDLFLCVFLADFWQFVEADAKRILIKGVTPDYRLRLGLDKA